MWRRKQSVSNPTKIERRLAALPANEILGWAETSLFGIGRGLRGSPEAMADAEQSAEVLLAAIRELRARRSLY